MTRRILGSSAFAWVLVLAAPSLAWTQATETEPSVKPGINRNFLDPDLDVEEWIARFEVESREVFAAKDAVLRALRLTPGMTVADVGAGTGLYTIHFARAVGPEGFVYAVDISPRFVEHIAQQAERLELDNIAPVLGGEKSVRLPPRAIDVAFVCDVYHHFEYPQTTLASLKKSMKPGGRLVVIDFERIPGVSSEWTLGHVRAGKETFRQEIERAGFEFLRETEIEGFSENYFLEFRAPGETP